MEPPTNGSKSLTRTIVRAILTHVKLAKGARTRAAILDQAIQLASVVGLDGLSIGALAERMQLSKSGLYAHFGSKDEMQLAILRRGMEQFQEVVLADALERPRGVDTIRALFDGWLRWSHERLDGGCLFVTASVEFDDRPGPVRDHLVEQYRQWYVLLVGAAQRAVADGDFRADFDCEQFAQDFNAILLAFNQKDRLFHDPEAECRARRALARLFENGRP